MSWVAVYRHDNLNKHLKLDVRIKDARRRCGMVDDTRLYEIRIPVLVMRRRIDMGIILYLQYLHFLQIN
jgi:hypothetical protein